MNADIVNEYERIKAEYENISEHYYALAKKCEELNEEYKRFHKKRKIFIAQEILLCVVIAVLIIVKG